MNQHKRFDSSILVHQPAYSPRFQPAEHWFSCLRHVMQLHNDEFLALGEQYGDQGRWLSIFLAMNRVPVQHCAAMIRHRTAVCGGYTV